MAWSLNVINNINYHIYTWCNTNLATDIFYFRYITITLVVFSIPHNFKKNFISLLYSPATIQQYIIARSTFEENVQIEVINERQTQCILFSQ